jgi:ribosome-binding protein aMBF1 (putative translation factor)
MNTPPVTRPPPRTTSFGSAMRRARAQAGLSQATLAEHMGFTAKTISVWESGHQCPSSRVLADLFECLQVDQLQRLLWVEMLRR